MAVTLTARAAERVRDYLDKRGRGLGLRVGVKKTGCSGWAYVIDYADEQGGERFADPWRARNDHSPHTLHTALRSRIREDRRMADGQWRAARSRRADRRRA